MRCVSSGPTNARICIIGEAPGEKEEESGKCFVGSAGYELEKMLKDAGLNRDNIYITNVVMDRPPGNDLSLWINPKKDNRDGTEIPFRGKSVRPHVVSDHSRLIAELRALRPNVVIAAGNTPLWALCSVAGGVGKWRGSTLESDVIPGLKVIPTYHPAAILRQYDWRYITVQDFRRARRESETPLITKPQHNFQLAPSFGETVKRLNELIALASQMEELWLVSDVEIKRNEILCVGIAWSKHDAICIPFYGPNPNADGSHFYFSVSEQIIVVELIRKLFCHSNVRLCNQNIAFDIQYFFWRFGIWPKAHFDTMVAQNVLFPTGKKGGQEDDKKKNKGAGGPGKRLDYIASMYCQYYVYWKDDGKFWEKPIVYPQLWEYNAKDCVYTFEVMEEQKKALAALALEPQMAFQMRTFQPAMQMMLRGVLVNTQTKRELKREVVAFIEGLHAEVKHMAGVSLIGDKGGFSPKKMQDFFYARLKLPIQKKKTHDKSGKVVMSVTCDDEALKVLAKREPLIKPLIQRINMIRSYETAVDVLEKRVDKDGRWRTAYNIAGTSTYRWASSENPFDSGLNLQNLTIGKDIL